MVGRLVVVGVLGVSVARADAQPAAPSASPTHRRSPSVAAALSVPPTLVGGGLAVAGLVIANEDRTCTGVPAMCVDHFDTGLTLTVAGGVLLAFGPSLGHVYAGHAWSTGLKVRLAGVGVAALGLAGLVVAPTDCGKIVCAGQGVSVLVIMGGAATFGVGAGIDAATAAEAASHEQAQVSLMPFATPSGTVPGVAFATTF